MLTIKTGNIFDSEMNALTCPVNCIPGVMGAGLAKQFCFQFGEGRMKSAHKTACEHGMDLGVPKFMGNQHDRKGREKIILFFPTKQHWKNPSKIEWIRDGLEKLIEWQEEDKKDDETFYRNHLFTSIAFPPLGCGLGGLKEEDVLPLIERFAERYEPECEYYRQ